MGLCGMSFCGLVLCLRWSSQTNQHFVEKGTLAGMTFGIFVTLWLEGSWNVLKKLRKRDQPGAEK